MKLKITLVLTIIAMGWNAQAQCDLTDPNLFLGDYYVYSVEPGLLGFRMFNQEGQAELVTLENTGANNWRQFDAVYLPDAGVGQDAVTFPFEFRPDCGVTLLGDTNTGLTCGTGIVLGAASGGSFDTNDDSEFTMFILENVTSDCGEAPSVIELRFSRDEPLAVSDIEVKPFSFAVTKQSQLLVESLQTPLAEIAIYSITGQVILNETPNINSYQKDLSGLNSGIYFVQARTAEGLEQTFKISL